MASVEMWALINQAEQSEAEKPAFPTELQVVHRLPPSPAAHCCWLVTLILDHDKLKESKYRRRQRFFMKQIVPPRQRPHSEGLWGECFRVMTDFLGHFYVCDPATAASWMCHTIQYVMHTLKMNVQKDTMQKKVIAIKICLTRFAN